MCRGGCKYFDGEDSILKSFGDLNMEKDKIDKIKKGLNLGATGRYPYGKQNPSDEGELKSAIVKEGDKILMVFGKPVEWVSMTKQGAKSLGLQLIKMSEE